LPGRAFSVTIESPNVAAAAVTSAVLTVCRFELGELVGSGEGFGDGSPEALAEGAAEGSALGATEGATDGSALGPTDGSTLGVGAVVAVGADLFGLAAATLWAESTGVTGSTIAVTSATKRIRPRSRSRQAPVVAIRFPMN
jgi:hypothetical protein